ncbi:MAG: DUF1559 domain-containing protein [Pirellulales bacterium]|nr:DUF1559 domain-containing protein [Pirellulales bacterium]
MFSGMKPHRRSALTLVELLVVIAIVSALMALLLPAVQSAREAGRRAQCANNLRQIGLAVHQYHEVVGTFPPGNVTHTAGICYGGAAGSAGYPSQDGANWCLAILPFLEQQPLYRQYDFDDFNEAPQNRVVRETRIPVFGCASDVGRDELGVPGSGPAGSFALNLPYRAGSYRAVSGRSDGIRFLDSAELGEFPRASRGAMHTVGVLGFSTESFAHVRDGTSQTLLVGESITRTTPSFRTFWAYSYAHYSLSAVTPQSRSLWGDYEACKQAGGTGTSLPCRRGWGSYHPGVLPFVFCDASVRPISIQIEMQVLAAMATIDGGETIGELP